MPDILIAAVASLVATVSIIVACLVFRPRWDRAAISAFCLVLTAACMAIAKAAIDRMTGQ